MLCLTVAFLSLQVMVGRSHHVVQAGDCANIGCTFSSFERSDQLTYAVNMDN